MRKFVLHQFLQDEDLRKFVDNLFPDKVTLSDLTNYSKISKIVKSDSRNALTSFTGFPKCGGHNEHHLAKKNKTKKKTGKYSVRNAIRHFLVPNHVFSI